MTTATRIYIVTGPDGRVVQLVRAAHPTQAIRYAVSNDYKASVATQEQLVEQIGSGAVVYDATERDTE